MGRPELQKFAGALQGKRAKAQRLGELMFEHDVGVSTTATYAVKQLDVDSFDSA